MTHVRIRQRDGRLRDCAFLAAAVVFSCAWYIPRLGFSSDDWAFLARYVNAADQSVIGLYRASFSEQHAMRPVQLWLCAALYRLFGLEPLGYHLFNAALLVVNPVLLYCVLREMKVARTVAVSTALMYAVPCWFSTLRQRSPGFRNSLDHNQRNSRVRALLRET